MNFTCQVFDKFSDIEPGYSALCAEKFVAAPQNVQWMKAWVKHCVNPVTFVCIFNDKELVYALPLEIEKRGALILAFMPGDRHANGNFAPASEFFLRNADQSHIAQAFNALSKAYPKIDLVQAQRQLPNAGGFQNPLRLCTVQRSANLALSAYLPDDFKLLVKGHSGKQKRKKQRSQHTKMSKIGPVSIRLAKTPKQVSEQLDTYFKLKAKRFAAVGIDNVFAAKYVQEFFKQLAIDSLLSKEPEFTVKSLYAGEELLAVIGCSHTSERLTVEFGGIEDKYPSTSPGEFLYYSAIEQACQDGIKIFDFGVGDEPYKRRWCDTETRHFDAYTPLSLKGHIYSHLLRAKTGTKRFIKSSQVLWPLVKSVRSKIKSS